MFGAIDLSALTSAAGDLVTAIGTATPIVVGVAVAGVGARFVIKWVKGLPSKT